MQDSKLREGIMKKNAIMCMVLMVSAVLFFGCVTTPVADESTPATVTVAEPDYKIVDNKAMATGIPVPAWYAAANESLSALKKLYPDYVAVTASADGENREALQFQLETFAVNQELSGRLSTYFNATAGAITETDGANELTRVIESLAVASTKAEFVGLAKEADYWILKEFKDGTRVYTYTVLYLMKEDLWEQQLDAQMKNLLSDEDYELSQPILDKAMEQIGDDY